VHSVRIRLCSACLGGEGGECHTPGCALWLNRAPDLPISALLYDDLDREDWRSVQRRAFAALDVDKRPADG